jgi:hypothetical protein
MLLRAVFDDYQHFEDALRALKSARVRRYEAFGPTNLSEIEDLMPKKGSYVRGWSTVGGIIGLAMFFVMCVTTSLIYSLYTGGKPPVSNVPFVIPAYEGTILVGAIFGFIAVLIYMMLGLHGVPRDYDLRYSEDSYGIEVRCKPGERVKIENLLQGAGAVEVQEIGKVEEREQ